MTDISALQSSFGIKGAVEIVAGQGGLPLVRVNTPAASGEVYLHGAHVTAWQPAGSSEMLFLSRESRFAEGRAIRGGIPVCFPWFGVRANDAQAPSHGLVRTVSWELDTVAQHPGGVTVALSTTLRDADRRWWSQPFHVEHRVTFGAALGLDLTVTNTGSDPMRIEEALHTYLLVDDAAGTRVRGLDGADYLDKTDGYKEKRQAGDVTFTGPTDRSFAETGPTQELLDPGLGRRVRIEKSQARSAVVWNPWQAGAAALADMGDEEWRQMICVEAANIRDAGVLLAAGERHTMTVSISVSPL